MPKFSHKSAMKLMNCHPDLRRLFDKVVQKYDCTILCGHRDKYKQDEAYYSGRSQLKYPKSKHNKTPSMAADVAPYFAEKPHIRWGDTQKFCHFAGYVLAVADELGIRIRWGGNWDRDDVILKDQDFNDLPHFELLE